MEKIFVKEKIHADSWINLIRIPYLAIRNLRADWKKSINDEKIN